MRDHILLSVFQRPFISDNLGVADIGGGVGLGFEGGAGAERRFEVDYGEAEVVGVGVLLLFGGFWSVGGLFATHDIHNADKNSNEG